MRNICSVQRKMVLSGKYSFLNFEKLHYMILRIWSLEDWEEIKSLRHPAAVRDFSADPSGKVLLTIANDKTLRAWDLTRGREAFTKSFRDQPERVLWGPDGRRYALQLTATLLQIQTLEESKEKIQILCKDRIMDVKFFRFQN